MNFLTNTLRYGSIFAALLGVVMIIQVVRVQAENKIQPANDPPVTPPSKPYAQAVAATGILEALSENVAVGVPSPGLVSKILVKVNDPVRSGQPLFKLDDRELRAEEITARAQREVAQAQIEVKQALLAKLDAQMARLLSVTDRRAISDDDLENRQQDVAIARAELTASRAQLSVAEASVQRIEQLIERLTVRAPRDGQVIQLNIREGEFAATAPKSPAMILGEIGKLQVRADVDEQNATRIRNGQQAVAYLKGDPNVKFPLRFIRIEPFVIPKISLTGSSVERVDTRVLQVIYSLERPADAPLYVGQQVDVFIEAPNVQPQP